MTNPKNNKKDYLGVGTVIFFIIIGIIIAILVLMFTVNPYSNQDNVIETNKVCIDDSNCLNDYCIPDDINCKEKCIGTCSATKKDFCIELPRWYSLNNGIVKPEYGFACPNK